jgi:hypothetical protein
MMEGVQFETILLFTYRTAREYQAPLRCLFFTMSSLKNHTGYCAVRRGIWGAIIEIRAEIESI